MKRPKKTAIVFGATGSVGGVVAERLAHDGWNVAVHCLHNREKAETVADKVRRNGSSTMVLQGDTSDADVTRQMVEDVYTEYGSVDGFVNLVFPDREYRGCRIDNMEWMEWKAPLESIHSYFNMCKYIVPLMRKNQFGRIVYISGGLAYRLYEGCSIFSTIKAGLNAFSKTLAIETGKDGITVNIVSPGKVVNPGMDTVKFSQDDLKRCPLGRFAAPADIADAVSYFFSDSGSFVTGQTLYVSGGEIMPMP